jgi:hypothetical protein
MGCNYLLVAIDREKKYYPMSRIGKLKARLAEKPADFSFDELRTLLCALGFEEIRGGKTGGSRTAFVHAQTGLTIRLHRPHPKSILKKYQICQIVDALTERGFLS